MNLYNRIGTLSNDLLMPQWQLCLVVGLRAGIHDYYLSKTHTKMYTKSPPCEIAMFFCENELEYFIIV